MIGPTAGPLAMRCTLPQQGGLRQARWRVDDVLAGSKKAHMGTMLIPDRSLQRCAMGRGLPLCGERTPGFFPLIFRMRLFPYTLFGCLECDLSIFCKHSPFHFG